MIKKAKEETATAAKRVTGALTHREGHEDTSWKREILEGRKCRRRSHDNGSKDTKDDAPRKSGEARNAEAGPSQEAKSSEGQDGEQAQDGEHANNVERAKDGEAKTGGEDRPAG